MNQRTCSHLLTVSSVYAYKLLLIFQQILPKAVQGPESFCSRSQVGPNSQRPLPLSMVLICSNCMCSLVLLTGRRWLIRDLTYDNTNCHYNSSTRTGGNLLCLLVFYSSYSSTLFGPITQKQIKNIFFS